MVLFTSIINLCDHFLINKYQGLIKCNRLTLLQFEDTDFYLPVVAKHLQNFKPSAVKEAILLPVAKVTPISSPSCTARS